MREFNNAMSEVRVSVEWLFSDIAESFKFIAYKKNLKLGMNAVGKQYIVSVLFRNILICLYGNTTSNIAMSYKYPKRYQRTLIRQMSGELRLTTSIM